MHDVSFVLLILVLVLENRVRIEDEEEEDEEEEEEEEEVAQSPVQWSAALISRSSRERNEFSAFDKCNS